MSDAAITLAPLPALYTTFAEYADSGYFAEGYLVSYTSPYFVSGQAQCFAAGLTIPAIAGHVGVAADGIVSLAGVAAVCGLGAVGVGTQTQQWTTASQPQPPIPSRDRGRLRRREEDAFMLAVLL